jgi:hypothetical protein
MGKKNGPKIPQTLKEKHSKSPTNVFDKFR